jgi:hypothetical protein
MLKKSSTDCAMPISDISLSVRETRSSHSAVSSRSLSVASANIDQLRSQALLRRRSAASLRSSSL